MTINYRGDKMGWSVGLDLALVLVGSVKVFNLPTHMKIFIFHNN